MTDTPKRRNKGQFSKGQSGNPKGRPKKSRNMATLFNELGDEVVLIGKDKVPMTRREAWMMNLWNTGINGDGRSSTNIINIMRTTGQLQLEEEPESELDGTAGDVLNNIIEREIRRRMAKMEGTAEANEPADTDVAADDQETEDAG